MHAKAVGLATCPSLVRPGLRAERWPLSSPECEPESLILAFVWGLQGWVLFSGALPACLSGAVPEASGRHAPPLWLGFLPTFKLSWQCLQEPWPTARSSLCCVFREQRQNKINWFPGRSSGRTGEGGRTARLPACLPSPPRGPGCRQPHPVGYFFMLGILRNQ